MPSEAKRSTTAAKRVPAQKAAKDASGKTTSAAKDARAKSRSGKRLSLERHL